MKKSNHQDEEFDVILPPYTAEPVSFRASGQIQDWGHKYLGATEVYGKTRGEGTVIFILDTAGEFTHPDLAPNTIPLLNANFTDHPAPDLDGHGTHCAGIACAVDNNIGVIGVAPGAKVVAVKVLNDEGSGKYSWIAAGIDHVIKAPLPDGYTRKVISMSFGGPSPSSLMYNAIKRALSAGIVIVAAAGNEGFTGENTIGYPGRYTEVITVASLKQDGQPSAFSSGGPEVDVAAPGSLVYSTHIDGGYALLSGTSMATPHCAGALALVMALHPTVTNPADIQALLKAKAKDVYLDGVDLSTGSGAPYLPGYLPKVEPPEEPEPPTENPFHILRQIFVSRKDIARMNEVTIVRMGLVIGAEVDVKESKNRNIDSVWIKLNDPLI